MARSALETVQDLYAAFGAGDIEKILTCCADPIDWHFVGPAKLGYTGRRRTRAELLDFFAKVAAMDDIHAFEPREMIAAGEHVTVIGWERTTAKPAGKQFETDWVHVFTVKDGKVQRFLGLYDSAASLAAR